MAYHLSSIGILLILLTTVMGEIIEKTVSGTSHSVLGTKLVEIQSRHLDDGYVIIKKAMSWNDAEEFCRLNNMRLAEFKEKQEAKLIIDKIFYISEPPDRTGKAHYSFSDLGLYQRYWIGLTDVGEEGHWRWGKGTDEYKPLSYAGLWYPGQPDHFDGKRRKLVKDEHCGALWNPNFYMRNRNRHTFADQNCDSKYFFICEELSPTIAPKAGSFSGRALLHAKKRTRRGERSRKHYRPLRPPPAPIEPDELERNFRDGDSDDPFSAEVAVKQVRVKATTKQPEHDPLMIDFESLPDHYGFEELFQYSGSNSRERDVYRRRFNAHARNQGESGGSSKRIFVEFVTATAKTATTPRRPVHETTTSRAMRAVMVLQAPVVTTTTIPRTSATTTASPTTTPTTSTVAAATTTASTTTTSPTTTSTTAPTTTTTTTSAAITAATPTATSTTPTTTTAEAPRTSATTTAPPAHTHGASTNPAEIVPSTLESYQSVLGRAVLPKHELEPHVNPAAHQQVVSSSHHHHCPTHHSGNQETPAEAKDLLVLQVPRSLKNLMLVNLGDAAPFNQSFPQPQEAGDVLRRSSNNNVNDAIKQINLTSLVPGATFLNPIVVVVVANNPTSLLSNNPPTLPHSLVVEGKTEPSRKAPIVPSNKASVQQEENANKPAIEGRAVVLEDFSSSNLKVNSHEDSKSGTTPVYYRNAPAPSLELISPTTETIIRGIAELTPLFLGHSATTPMVPYETVKVPVEFRVDTSLIGKSLTNHFTTTSGYHKDLRPEQPKVLQPGDKSKELDTEEEMMEFASGSFSNEETTHRVKRQGKGFYPGGTTVHAPEIPAFTKGYKRGVGSSTSTLVPEVLKTTEGVRAQGSRELLERELQGEPQLIRRK